MPPTEELRTEAATYRREPAMKPVLSTLCALAVMGFGLLTPATAQAQAPVYVAPSYPSYYGSGYYYGLGNHDLVPHWHGTVTPSGRVYYWYGVSREDLVPHVHSYTPYTYQGYYHSPWGYTENYYPRYPAYYSPW